MAYDVYEITVELENGDWHYTQVNAADYDFHRAVIDGLDFAYQKRGKLVSINKIGIAATPVVPGYTSKGARLLPSVTTRKGREP